MDVQQVDDDSYGEAMKSAGLPEFVVTMLVGIQRAIREGALDIESNDFEKLLWRKPVSMSEA